MVEIKELEEQLSIYNSQFRRDDFEILCEEHNFVKGEYLENLNVNWWLAKLIDHLIIFETGKGEKYYVSNTFLDLDDIWQNIKDYDLAGYAMIIKNNFWHKNCIPILFDYERLNEAVILNEAKNNN